MAYNGSGVYSPPAASFPAVTGTVIDSAKYNAVVNDIATALTGVITKDGQTTVTANLPMATYRHTGVSDGTALTDYASVNQVVDNVLVYGGASAAGTDTYAVSLPISPGAYVAGNRYQFLADVANTGACTINFNGLGAKSIKMVDGNDPFTNAIQIGAADVIYDGTNFVLLNPFFDFLSVTGQVTATHTELNILDGVTSTTAELNKLDGFGGTLADKTGFASTDDVIDNFPSGTRMLFQQSAAPTGWTRDTTAGLDDHALRIVTSGTFTAGTLGTTAFSTIFGKTATDSHTLTGAESGVPAHDHPMRGATVGVGGTSAMFAYGNPSYESGTAATNASTAADAASGHTHGMDIRVKYLDQIIGVKD